jgi:UDP-N-acetylmuramoyl-tripeptide--D-alanyl-D-alanine ligase
VLTFGLDAAADVSADWTSEQGITVMQAKTPAGLLQIHIPLLGRHNVMNTLAAIAVCMALNIDTQDIQAGLKNMHAVSGRLQRESGMSGMVILNDTYNANPTSLRAALEVLASEQGPHWLVLGDMGELGGDAAALHRECGDIAKQMGVERLYACGELSRESVQAFGGNANWFASHEDLARQLIQDWPGQGTVLVKGSRQMHMENVVRQLQSGEEAAT